jgi:hypothetical protein
LIFYKKVLVITPGSIQKMKKYTLFFGRVLIAGTLFGVLAGLAFWVASYLYGDRFAVNRAVGVGCLVFCFSAMWSSVHWSSRWIAHLKTRRLTMTYPGVYGSAVVAALVELCFAAIVPMAAFLATALPDAWAILADRSGFFGVEREGYAYAVFVWALLPIGGGLLSLVGARVVYYLVWWTLLAFISLWRSVCRLTSWSWHALMARPEDLGIEPQKKA